jgi:hypothetical protein
MVDLFWFLHLISMEMNKVPVIDFSFILVEPAVPENIGASDWFFRISAIKRPYDKPCVHCFWV